MKKVIVILLCSLSVSFLNAQEISLAVTYDKALKKVNDRSEKAPQILKGIKYELRANQEEGVFRYVKVLEVEEGMNRRFIGMGGGKATYYKNLKEDKKIEQREFNDRQYIVDDEKFKYKWVLEKESKRIGKYLCYKATTRYTLYDNIRKKKSEHVVTVWYTPEIPLPFGPSGYDGLPGLVLEAQKGGVYFIASEVKVSQESIKIDQPTGDKVLSLTGFDKMVLEKMEEIYGKNFYEKYQKRKKTKN